jgi:hypothetical protein
MTSDSMYCPDCGGLIGATETTDEGRPCTCFKSSDYKSSAGASAPDSGGGDTSVMGQVVAKTKVCCKCGKDLTGKKRLRDSLGYWCVECHKADEAAHAPKGVKCAECGRIVAEGAITNYEGIRICGKCVEDRKAQAKRDRKFGKVDDRLYKEHDRQRLFLMLGVLGVLALIILLRALHLLGNLF